MGLLVFVTLFFGWTMGWRLNHWRATLESDDLEAKCKDWKERVDAEWHAAKIEIEEHNAARKDGGTRKKMPRKPSVIGVGLEMEDQNARYKCSPNPCAELEWLKMGKPEESGDLIHVRLHEEERKRRLFQCD